MFKFKALIKNKFFVFACCIFLIFMFVVEYNQFSQRSGIQKEIADLKNQENQLQQKNQNLQNLISYLQTDSYKQKAAREQLNLKKNGEVVYSFAQPQTDTQQASPAANASQNSSGISNAQKWWNYFFNQN